MIGFAKSFLGEDAFALSEFLGSGTAIAQAYANEINFAFLFACLWWYVSPFAVPPLTNAITLFILGSPRIRNTAADFLSTRPAGKALFHFGFGFVTFRRSYDLFFFGASFLYKGIILESKLGSRRFAVLMLLLLSITAAVKTALAVTGHPNIAGPYLVMMALKFLVFSWAEQEQPVRFPHIVSLVSRSTELLEVICIAIASQDPREIIVGAFLGGLLSRMPLNKPTFSTRLLGPIKPLPYSRTVPKTPRRVAAIILYFLPKLSALILIGISIAQYVYNIFPLGVNLFCAIPSGQLHMLLMPSFGALNLTHLLYTCFSAYVVMYHMHQIFIYQAMLVVYCALLQALTSVLYVAASNLSYKCPPFSNQCVPPGTEIVGITAVLLGVQVFTGIMSHKAEWRNYALTALRAGGEVALIYLFMPEIDGRTHLLGALAGFILAVSHTKTPRFMRQLVQENEITIERPFTGLNAKVTGRQRFRESGDATGRKSRITINTRAQETRQIPDPAATPSPYPGMPPKVILILGQSPPMYVPVTVQNNSGQFQAIRGPNTVRARFPSLAPRMQNYYNRARMPPNYRPL